MDVEKLERAMAIVLSKTMNPDVINDMTGDGLKSFAEEFERLGIDFEVIKQVRKFYKKAQEYNGSQGVYTSQDLD